MLTLSLASLSMRCLWGSLEHAGHATTPQTADLPLCRNQLTGRFPESWADSGAFSAAMQLKLWGNRLAGEVPPGVLKWVSRMGE